jgi:hypothetical protein
MRSYIQMKPSASEQAEYFYDMLHQLVVIGQQAGGKALIDATLIAGLVSGRKAETLQSPAMRRAA